MSGFMVFYVVFPAKCVNEFVGCFKSSSHANLFWQKSYMGMASPQCQCEYETTVALCC